MVSGWESSQDIMERFLLATNMEEEWHPEGNQARMAGTTQSRRSVMSGNVADTGTITWYRGKEQRRLGI